MTEENFEAEPAGRIRAEASERPEPPEEAAFWIF